MAGKAGKKDKDEAQIERFKKTAKDLEADQSSEAFERAFRKVVKRPDASRRDG